MKELTPQQKRKLEKLLKVAEAGEVAIVEHLFEVEEKFEEKVLEIKADFTEKLEDAKASVPDLKNILEQVKGKDGKDGQDSTVPGPKGEDGQDGKSVVGPPGKDGRDGRDGKDAEVDTAQIALEATARAVDELSPLIPTIDEIEKDIPKLGLPIRDSLELLRDDERLDRKAIRGITVSSVAPANPEIGDLWVRT